MKNIADQTERELIAVILRLYTNDEKAINAIAYHIAAKLTQRRTILRDRRRGVPEAQCGRNRRLG